MPTQKPPLVYLDQNIFSWMLDPAHAQLRAAFQRLPAQLVVSDTHLREMRGRPREYAELLESLNCLLLVQHIDPNSVGNLLNRASLVKLDGAFERLADHQKSQAFYDGYEKLFELLRYMMGGDQALDHKEAMRGIGSGVKEGLTSLLADAPDDIVAIKLTQVDEISDWSYPGDITEIWQTIDRQISATRTGDQMRHISALERVDFVLSKQPDEDRANFLQQYPFQFATARPLTVGELAGLSLAFFTMGAVKTKGIISGNRSERRFAAQMRDTHHIEAAAYSDAFLTADQDAAILAAMTYAHAGVATEALIYRAHPTR